MTKTIAQEFATGHVRVSASLELRAEALRCYGKPVASIFGGLMDWGAGDCANDARFSRTIMARYPNHLEEARQRARVAAEACRMRLRADDGRPRAF